MFQAPVILWNFDTGQLVSKYDSHKFRVESVTFSCDSKYLISLGGHDDNNIIVWNVEEREAVCCKCYLFLLLAVFLFVFIDGCKVSKLFLPSSPPLTFQFLAVSLAECTLINLRQCSATRFPHNSIRGSTGNYEINKSIKIVNFCEKLQIYGEMLNPFITN